MAKQFDSESFGTIYDAFEFFKSKFLKEKKSIFTESPILCEKNLKQIKKHFIENADATNASYDEKIKTQLLDNEDVSNEARELFAHAVWLWGLFASDMTENYKKNDVKKWLSKDSLSDNKNKFKKLFFDHGLGSAGQYHKTNKPVEIAYLMNFFERVLNAYNNNEAINYIDLIKNNEETNFKPYEMQLGNENPKKASMYNILLHLFDPKNHLRAASFSHKEKIVEVFEPLLGIEYKNSSEEKDDGIYKDIDKRIIKIQEECANKFGRKYFYNEKGKYAKLEWNSGFNFYHPDFENIWRNDLNFESKNMILYGAPGTGKTYSAEKIVKSRKDILGNVEYEIVQFHPSYGYEDFIEGIKPTGMTKGQMKFELKNGIFKQMCIDAFKNLVDVAQNNAKLKTYYFIADEVNRAELSRVFGELLLCLEGDKRLRIEGGKVVGTMIKTQSSNLWTENDVVVCIDDEGKPVVATEDNKDNWYFGVPENIYFIGTMNDIDRSVDSFDMALRRRFVWKKYRCDYDVVLEKYSEAENVDKYIEACEALNNHIVKDFGLSDSYELGHSYFMQAKSLNNTELKRVWDERISPILREYLRAQFADAEIDKKLKDAQKTFQL